MNKEEEKLEEKFKEFLKKEFLDISYESENNLIKTMRMTFKAGALAGTDLFLEYYQNPDKE